MLRKMSPRARTVLGVVVIIVASILVAIYAPRQSPSPILGPSPTATVVVTNSVEKLELNREIEFKGVNLTIKQVELAEKFSDDKSRKGKYTLRLFVEAVNNGKDMIGLNYANEVYIILPDGQEVRTKRMSVKPVAMPGEVQRGFFDYPVDTQVELTGVQLRFSDGQMVVFEDKAS